MNVTRPCHAVVLTPEQREELTLVETQIKQKLAIGGGEDDDVHLDVFFLRHPCIYFHTPVQKTHHTFWSLNFLPIKPLATND